MAIIAMAREFGAQAEELAQELAGAKGRVLDREDIEAGLAKHGLDLSRIEKFDEKRPGLWASLSQERDDYLHYLKLVIYEAAMAGPCVMVGRGAGAILKGLPNLANVRVIAPLSMRVQRVRTQYGLDERHALQLIERTDHERAGFQKYFFAMDWYDPRGYGLVVNTGLLGLGESAALVKAYRDLVAKPEAEAAATQRLTDLLLGHRVVTEVVYVRKIPVHFLEAEARGDRVVLHGVANTQIAIDEAAQVARTVPGVATVDSAIQIVQEFSVMP